MLHLKLHVTKNILETHWSRLILQTNKAAVIMAMMAENVQENEDPFKMVMVTKSVEK